MIDILSKLDKNNKIIYSYKETVDDSYIKFLQDKYNIKVYDNLDENKFDLICSDINKDDNTIYKNCFTDNSLKDEPNEYRPIFWYNKEDYIEYIVRIPTVR